MGHWCPKHAIDATRVRLTMAWVVCFSISLMPSGSRRSKVLFSSASDDLAAKGAVDAEGVVFDLELLADADRRGAADRRPTTPEPK